MLPSDAYLITDISGIFYTAEIIDDTIVVSVDENTSLEQRTGSFHITGCNESLQVDITQAGAPCEFVMDVDTIEVDYTGQTAYVEISTNGDLSAVSDETFVTPSFNTGMDSLVLAIAPNQAADPRLAEIEISTCDGLHTVVVSQAGLTGVYSFLNGNGLSVYPNPVRNGHLNIVMEEMQGTISYSIADLAGKVLQNGQLFNKSGAIDLRVEPGIYMLKIENNGVNYSGSIIVL